MAELTGKQGLILGYIQVHITRHGVAPTYREIMHHFDMKSPNSSVVHLKALEKKGFITFVKGTARGIRLTERRCVHCGELNP